MQRPASESSASQPSSGPASRTNMTHEQASLPLPAEWLEAMRTTEQNPRYHAEGNVLTHTEMVLSAYHTESSQFDLDESDHEVLYWATALHDIGKARVTHWHQNRWRAKGHERAGVAPARDLLLQRPEISTSQRKRILDLVKYHAVPLQWGLRKRPLVAYQRLATRTDVRLLGIFAHFDIVGRICEKKNNVLDLIHHFNQQIVPKIHYEMGTFEQMQAHYQNVSHQQKNALWQSLKQEIRLTERLLQVEKSSREKPLFTAVIPIGSQGEHRAEIEAQGLSHFKYYNAEPLSLKFTDPHDRESQLRQLKHFVSVYGRERQHLVIDGLPLDPEVRTHVAEFCRKQGGHIEYLFVERRLEELLSKAEDEDHAVRLRAAHDALDYPHPWEAHRITLVD